MGKLDFLMMNDHFDRNDQPRWRGEGDWTRLRYWRLSDLIHILFRVNLALVKG